jgi:hypothetical protein
MRNASHKICKENQNTHFVFSNFFSKIVPFMIKSGKILQSGADHRWQYGACALHDIYLRLQIHTLRSRNTHCFSTVTIVVRTRLNGRLHIHFLYCYRSQNKQRLFPYTLLADKFFYKWVWVSTARYALGLYIRQNFHPLRVNYAISSWNYKTLNDGWWTGKD